MSRKGQPEKEEQGSWWPNPANHAARPANLLRFFGPEQAEVGEWPSCTRCSKARCQHPAVVRLVRLGDTTGTASDLCGPCYTRFLDENGTASSRDADASTSRRPTAATTRQLLWLALLIALTTGAAVALLRMYRRPAPAFGETPRTSPPEAPQSEPPLQFEP